MTVYAFIDAQNLKKAVEAIDKQIDYKRFYLWLQRKHNVDRAIMFLGWIPSKESDYNHFKKIGFDLVFREVDRYEGMTKANVDICLTIYALDHLTDYEKALLITADGDFYDLVERWKQDDKFAGVISPSSSNKTAKLLKRACSGNISYIPNLIHKFEDRS